MEQATNPSPEIFRAYDIRGVVGETLTDTIVYQVGRAYATQARHVAQRRVVVGGDGRASTDGLRRQLLAGLRAGGMDVLDIGRVPTPLLYFAAEVLGTGAGVMITGSHNPPEYNGLKMMLEGAPLTHEHIQGLRDRVLARDFSTGAGTIERVDILDRYLDRVVNDVRPARPLKVVADCGNGVAGVVAPRLLQALGCEVVSLFAEVDGTFPNHHPDPAEPENLTALIAAVAEHRADLGVAFDGDGDRLGVVTNDGEIIWPDRTMMLFARDILRRNPGAGIVFDVKCSRHLPELVRACGGKPTMWKTGHSHIKAKIRASGALFGGEFSGHLCFAERWFGFDDGVYSAARLVELLAAERRTSSAVFGELPTAIATPEIKVPTTETGKFEIVERLLVNPRLNDGEAVVTKIDGLRLDYRDAWGLVRASNTSPVLTLRFEADDFNALRRVQAVFSAALADIDEALAFAPWPGAGERNATP